MNTNNELKNNRLIIGKENTSMDDNIISSVWPEWKIVNKIGRGAFGVVYEAVRTDYSVESHAAIKVISIPQDESDIDTLRSEGMSNEASRTYLQGIVNDFVNEIQILESFKGVQNIVSVEDYKVVEKNDGVGWDILIRMELLTPLNKYISDRVLSEQEVIKLGVDICSALELCSQRNVIHRDIKPENIFVNQFGDFKLGDFGIARKLESVTAGLSRKGTYMYMAPEVEKTTQYDATVDLYSLGLVLYRLMNKNRMPFLDTERQMLNPNERMEAIRRRLNGEPLVAPCEASSQLSQVILCACSYYPSWRFVSATAMKNALLNVNNNSYKEYLTDLNKTESVLATTTMPIMDSPNYSSQNTSYSQNIEQEDLETDEPKRSIKKPIIVLAIIVLALIYFEGAFIISKLSNKNNNNEKLILKNEGNIDIGENESESIINENETDIVSEESEEDEDIRTTIEEADKLASEGDYGRALAIINSSLKSYSSSEQLHAKETEYTNALIAQSREQALKEANDLAAKGDYISAIDTLNSAQRKYGENSELSEKVQEYEDSYVSDVIANVEGFVQISEFENAENVLKEAINVFPDNQQLIDETDYINNSKPKDFISVCMPYESSGFKTPASFKMGGNDYANGFTLNSGKGNYALFNLEGKYSSMEFDLGHIDGSDKTEGIYNIYLDGQYSETISLGYESLVTHFSINLNNALQMKIVGANSYVIYGFANAILYPNGARIDNSDNEYIQGDYLLDVNTPYEYKGFDTPESFKMCGKDYANGFTLNASNGSYAIFNLEGKYSSMEFDLGHIDGSDKTEGIYNIYLDGQYSETISLDNESLVTHFSVNLKNALQMKIVGADSYVIYGFANVVVY